MIKDWDKWAINRENHILGTIWDALMFCLVVWLLLEVRVDPSILFETMGVSLAFNWSSVLYWRLGCEKR